MRSAPGFRWLLGLGVIIAAVALARPPAAGPELAAVAWDPALLESGDLLFRRGRDLASDVVLASDRESRFSHVGIVARAGPLLVVVHTVPAEDGSAGVAVAVPPGEFLGAQAATEAALFRLRGARREVPRAAAAIALGFARRRIPFDSEFRLDTADRMYCTELVWRAFRQAGIDLIDGRFDRLSLPFHDGPAVLPSTLLHSPELYPVAHFVPDRRSR